MITQTRRGMYGLGFSLGVPCAPYQPLAFRNPTRRYFPNPRKVRAPRNSKPPSHTDWDQATDESAAPRKAPRTPSERLSRRGCRMAPCHLLSTLNPTLLTAADHITLSGRKTIRIAFPNSRNGPRGDFQLMYSRHRVNGPRIPFPSECAGFLYYQYGNVSPLGGGIRFRVTSDDVPSSFGRGSDLPLPSGCPWEILLLRVTPGSIYSPIRDQLVQENLVAEERLKKCSLRVPSASGRKITPENMLFSLNQEFVVRFDRDLHLTIVGPALHTLTVTCFRAKLDQKDIFPWAGSALARFEPSRSPEHAGRRVVFLRIIRILTPVSCTVDEKEYKGRVLKPEEGELLAACLWGRAPSPWSYDIDKSGSRAAAALRVLWDNSGPL
ncbi:hypothetical protein K438DRAFT_1966731 [Mycena galopus ATCC 62051]|nr:hypothetical protein K438DRAFT_1966731 [Mycena galopus ATCC 62051]